MLFDDWTQLTKHFLCPIRRQHSLERFELVWWESVSRGSSTRAWKLSSRLFSRPDWLPLGLRGWHFAQCDTSVRETRKASLLGLQVSCKLLKALTSASNDHCTKLVKQKTTTTATTTDVKQAGKLYQMGLNHGTFNDFAYFHLLQGSN